MNKTIIPLIYVLIFLLSASSFAQSEDDENPDDLPGDPGAVAPINDYIPVLIFGAAGLGIYFLRKKEVEKSTKKLV